MPSVFQIETSMDLSFIYCVKCKQTQVFNCELCVIRGIFIVTLWASIYFIGIINMDQAISRTESQTDKNVNNPLSRKISKILETRLENDKVSSTVRSDYGLW